jgi:hypothetical protein
VGKGGGGGGGGGGVESMSGMIYLEEKNLLGSEISVINFINIHYI